MAQTLKYVIGKDYRPLTVLEAKGGNTFTPDYDKSNWVQARQYEDNLRQVFVEITNEDGSAYDLTGANVLFEGILPDNEHKILDNSHVVFYEDPTTGKFRFDMPAQAFSVAGQYKQAFFRVVKDYRNIATLEFKFEVLADMVVTGMVARDYISPLEEFFNAIKDEQIKDSAELKKIVDDKINEITNLMTALNQTNTATLSELSSAKTALSALEEKIKQDGLFTQGEAEEFKQEILNEFETFKNSINETFDDFLNKISSKISGGSVNSLVKDYNVKGSVGKLKDFANKISKDAGFKILFATDQHYRVSEYTTDPIQGTNYAKAFPLSLSMTNNLAILDDVVDAAVFNGDNVDGAISLNQAYPSDMIAKIIKEDPHETPNVKYAKSINRTLINATRDALPSTDVYINLGNHDDNSIAQKYEGYILDKDDLLDVYEFDSNNFGEERYDFSCYKDYPKAKVRIGIIGAYDNPEIYDGDTSGGGRGNVKYRRGYHSVITQETLNFVKKSLETCPDDYTMIWFSHVPLKGYFNGATETTSDVDGLPIRVNHELLTGMFSAYANRRVFSGTGTNQDYPASISVDFTKSKGNIAGLIFGHEHKDKDMQNINGVPGIVRQCFLAASRADGDKFDTIEQYSFDVIELDTNSKQVIFKRFGDGAMLVMDTNIEKIQKDLAWCKEQINTHNGALGFDIHPYPRFGLPGFMPYDDYMFVKNFEKRTKLDGKINLSTLTPGLYYGTRDNFDILPPDLMTNNILVDVTGANDHRIAVLTSQGQAKQWYMTWSSGTSSNWKLRAAELRLFRGQVSLKAGTKISFTQTIPINDNNSSMTLYKVVGISPSGLWSITLPSFNGDLNAFVISGVKTEEPYQNTATKVKYRLTNDSFTIDSIAGVVNGTLNNDPYTGMTIIAIDAIQ